MFCTNCGKEVSEDHAFCQHCGAATSNEASANSDSTSKTTAPIELEPQEKISDFLRLLCVLTIIGSIFGIFRGLIYEMITAAGDWNDNYLRGFLYTITNFGTLIGAILMLLRQKRGLYIYTASQLAYIMVVFVASFVYKSENYFEGAETFAFALALFFLLPSILFLFLYWMKVNVNQLTK
jgi:hypothetical protein